MRIEKVLVVLIKSCPLLTFCFLLHNNLNCKSSKGRDLGYHVNITDENETVKLQLTKTDRKNHLYLIFDLRREIVACFWKFI